MWICKRVINNDMSQFPTREFSFYQSACHRETKVFRSEVKSLIHGHKILNCRVILCATGIIKHLENLGFSKECKGLGGNPTKFFARKGGNLKVGRG